MEFALTLEVSELINKNGISDYIMNVSDYVSEFLEDKDYGDDLKTIYVGIICVAPEFDFFSKSESRNTKRAQLLPFKMRGLMNEQTH